MADVARLAEVIEPVVKAMGFELVRVKLTSSEAGAEPALQVMAEDPATGQLVLDQCAALSHAISDELDALEERGEELITGAYRLEVSSPGIDRPLTRVQDWIDWAGFDARVKMASPLNGRKQFDGRIVASDGDSVTLDVNKLGEVAVPLAQIAGAKLILTDALIKATAPLSTEGVDQIVEDAPHRGAGKIQLEG